MQYKSAAIGLTTIVAIIALFHDVILTIGIFSLFNIEINLSIVAALLTIVGYSMNDTVVIFDRVRENLKKHLSIKIFESFLQNIRKKRRCHIRVSWRD